MGKEGGGEQLPGGYVASGADGHKMVPRLYLRESGDTVYKRPVEVWR